MRALWRSTLARLATSPRLKAYAQSRRIGVALARRYTGGTSVDSATELALGLHRQDGIQVSLFHLGEYVRSAAEVAAQVAAKHAAIEALGRAGLNGRHETGVMYNPLSGQWMLSSDTDVNYMLVATRDG